jgi:hypothetical protein
LTERYTVLQLGENDVSDFFQNVCLAVLEIHGGFGAAGV